jgi:hypothetical protein
MKPLSLILTLATLLSSSGLALAENLAARISLVSGQVEIRKSIIAVAKPAFQLTTLEAQNIITTREKSASEIQIGANTVQMEPDSELEIVQVDANNLKLNLRYGVVNLNLVDASVLPQFELRAGAGRLLMSEPGRVSVDFGPPPAATAIRLLSGLGSFENDGRNYSLQVDTQLLLRGDTPRISPLNEGRPVTRTFTTTNPIRRSDERSSNVRNSEIIYYDSSPSFQGYTVVQSPRVITTYAPQYVYRNAVDPFFFYAPFFIGASLAFNYSRFNGYPFYSYRGFNGSRFNSFRGPNVGPAGPVNLRGRR